MIIDCDRCMMRDLACGSCVMQVLLRAPQAPYDKDHYELDHAERAAIAVLADSGLVPPLRLAASDDHGELARFQRRVG